MLSCPLLLLQHTLPLWYQAADLVVVVGRNGAVVGFRRVDADRRNSAVVDNERRCTISLRTARSVDLDVVVVKEDCTHLAKDPFIMLFLVLCRLLPSGC